MIEKTLSIRLLMPRSPRDLLLNYLQTELHKFILNMII